MTPGRGGLGMTTSKKRLGVMLAVGWWAAYTEVLLPSIVATTGKRPLAMVGDEIRGFASQPLSHRLCRRARLYQHRVTASAGLRRPAASTARLGNIAPEVRVFHSNFTVDIHLGSPSSARRPGIKAGGPAWLIVAGSEGDRVDHDSECGQVTAARPEPSTGGLKPGGWYQRARTCCAILHFCQAAPAEPADDDGDVAAVYDAIASAPTCKAGPTAGQRQRLPGKPAIGRPGAGASRSAS